MSRTRAKRPGRGPTLVWHLVAAFFLLTVPVRVLLGDSVWSLAADRLPAVVGPAIAYLVAGAVLSLSEPERPSALRSVVTLAVVLSAFLVGMLLIEDPWYSRRLLLVGLALSAAFITAPSLLSRRVLTVAGAGSVGMALASMAMSMERPTAPPPPDPEVTSEPAQTIIRRITPTAHGSVTAEHHVGHLSPSSQGGGIARLDRAYLVATGDGDLHRIEWTHEGDSLRVTELPLSVPLNRAEFAAAVPEEIPEEWFRVAHVLVRPTGDSLQVVVSHHHWRAERSCFVLRLSTVTVARTELDRPTAVDRWRTLYDTQPCLPIRDAGVRGYRFAGAQIGGRLADLGSGSVLVTVGDLMFDGLNAPEVLAQDPTGDYGKVLAVHADGTAEQVSMGHRNLLGLHIDSEGRIWATENGPRGGDALHEIVWGANYGWPYVTHGTEYGEVTWPLEGGGPWNEADFRPAVFAWVPSIVPSNLIEVRRGPLEEWRGDLLIGTLSTDGLYRVRREGGRVVYVERIPLGRRIRDLVEGENGRIVIWTDGGEIIRLSRSVPSAGAALFARCIDCHGRDPDAPSRLGPNLHGIYGRPVAAEPDFDYSSALRALPGRWWGAELDAFLANPQAYAPGTTMMMEPMSDPEERTALIEYLRSLR